MMKFKMPLFSDAYRLFSATLVIIFITPPDLLFAQSCPADTNTTIRFPSSKQPLVVRNYDLSTGFIDNGTLLDGDIVRVYIQGLMPPGNVSTQPIGIPLTSFAQNPNLIDFRFRLPSFKNQLSVMGLSPGVVPPTTVGTTIFGVEISSKTPSNTSGLTSKVFSHSTLGTTFIAPIECRRVQPSTNNNSGKLSSNLETQQVPIKTWWNQRMPCNTQAHHIVTSFNNSNIPSVENSRRIIAACGIDINDAINGVPLPDNITIGSSGSSMLEQPSRQD